MRRLDEYKTMILVVVLFTIWSAIIPVDYAVWAFEIGLGLIAAIILVATHRKFQFSGLAYLLVAIHFVILAIGAKFTYAEMPFFDWLKDYFHLSRNHFDRVGHFFQGFVPAIIVRELLIRTTELKNRKLIAFLSVCVCLAFSAYYEILEWRWVMMFYQNSGGEWLGMQGDIWDAQWDMLMALLGATFSIWILSKTHDRSIQRLTDKSPAVYFTAVKGYAKILFLLTFLYEVLAIIVYYYFSNSTTELADYYKEKYLISIVVYWILSCFLVILIAFWREKWKEYILSFISIGITLLIAEIVLRLFFPYHSMMGKTFIRSPVYHHQFPPNKIMFDGFDTQSNPILIRTNENGFRTPYSKEEFLRYKSRIVILGDSFVHGVFVAEEFTFPVVLEKYLRHELRRRDIAVLNTGVSSYSPLLEKRLFEGVIKDYKPTITILVLDATDIGDDYKYSTQLVRKDGQSLFPYKDQKDMAYKGAVWELLIDPVIFQPLYFPIKQLTDLIQGKYWENYYEMQLYIDGKLETNRFFIYRHPLSKTKRYFDETMRNIQSIASTAHKIGSDFILVISPRYNHWNPEESPENWELQQYSLHDPWQFEYLLYFEKQEDKVDFPIYSLLDDFRYSREYPLVFWNDPHWTAKGHKVVGMAMTKYLLDRDYFGNTTTQVVK